MMVEIEVEVMLVEVMVVAVEGLQMSSVKFVINMVMKIHFVIIAMKKIMFLHNLRTMEIHNLLLQHNYLLCNKL